MSEQLPVSAHLPALNQELVLSPDQEEIYARFPKGAGAGAFYFITGRAGTGKSTLLRKFVKETPLKKVIVAPTGLAAVNVGGQTIHSLFQLPPAPLEPESERITIFSPGSRKRRLFNQIDVLVIDEISMVRADLLDAMDFSLRRNREDDRPFGGVSVVAFGDPWQLEPIVSGQAEAEMLTEYYPSPYFFDAKVIQNMGADIYELSTVHRQMHDQEFLWALNQIRGGNCEQLDFINSRVGADVSGGPVITLTATNARATTINLREMAMIPAPAQFFEGKVIGDFGSDLPTDLVLQLKPGAQVMFVRNGKTWVNGSIGTVESFGDDKIVVRLANDKRVDVTKESWQKIRYQWDRDRRRIIEEPVGEFIQYPLKLAWAVTIHKSQGLTFDRMILDLDRAAFSNGQTYVALSRVRTLSGLSLIRPVEVSDVLVSHRVMEFARSTGLAELS